MPMGSDRVCLLGNTGSDRRTVKVTRLTHLRHRAEHHLAPARYHFPLADRPQSVSLQPLSRGVTCIKKSSMPKSDLRKGELPARLRSLHTLMFAPGPAILPTL